MSVRTAAVGQKSSMQFSQNEGMLQRTCACGNHSHGEGECESCQKKRMSLQRSPSGRGGDMAGHVAPPIVHEVLREPGSRLDQETKSFLQEAFGWSLNQVPITAMPGGKTPEYLEINRPDDSYEQQADKMVAQVMRSHNRTILPHHRSIELLDFSSVRLHTSPKAAQAATAIQARAFTVGSDIVFGPGTFAPSNKAGRELLVHELAHVVQQTGTSFMPLVMRQVAGDAQALATPPVEEEQQASTETTGESQQQAQVVYDMHWLEHEDPIAARILQRMARDILRLGQEVNRELVPLGIAARRQEVRSIDEYFDFWTQISENHELSPANLARYVYRAQSALRIIRTVIERSVQHPGAVQANMQRLLDQSNELIHTGDNLRQTRVLQMGVQVLEEERQASDRRRRIVEAVDFIVDYVDRHWFANMDDRQARLHGLVIARRLLLSMRFDSEQVREVLDTLNERSPQLLEQALFRGGTVRALHDGGISGLQAYRAEGEGLFSGAQRASAESRMADPLRYRQFTTAETLEAVAWAILGTFEGIGNALLNNIRGIISIFTAEFWTGIHDFFTNFLPTFIDNEDMRFQMGQMVGQASIQEERSLATADPSDFGRTVGNVFGQALVEIALSFIGLGWVLRAVRASPRLMRLAGPLVRLAQRVARTSTAARGLRAAQMIAEAIGAMSRRLRALRNRIPAITRLGRLRRELRAAELAEEELAAAVRRVERLEADARRALASGNEELAQRHISEMNEASEALERQIAGMEGQTGATQPNVPERPVAERPAEASAREEPSPRAAETQEFLDNRPIPEELVDRASLVQRITPDGAHTITITRRGQIMRCTTCEELADRFQRLLQENPQLSSRLTAIQEKATRAAQTGNAGLADEASREAADLERTLRDIEGIAERNARSSERASTRLDPDLLAEVDRAVEGASTPRVTGGSRPRIEGTRVPTRRHTRLDVQDITREGENVTQALARIERMIGKKISDTPLAAIWEQSRNRVLNGRQVSSFTREQVIGDSGLYNRVRDAFWDDLAALPDGHEARAFLDEAGFVFRDQRAPFLDVATPDIPPNEIQVSLDHIAEKARGDNWLRAIDADNLEFAFRNPNSYREIIQMRHPSLRQ